jgi:3-(3-hydroxy-phenyl)propionate hydroxylase
MFGQPFLETAAGDRVKLDDALGTGFAVVAVGTDPAGWLTDPHREYWRGLGATLVRIEPARTAQRAGRAGPQGDPTDTVVLYDVLGAFRDLLLGRPDEQVFLLRPDRYVAAAGRPRDLDRLTDDLRPLLGAAG